VGVEAVAWHAAVVEAAGTGRAGPTLFDALTGSWPSIYRRVGSDNFVGGNWNDTASKAMRRFAVARAVTSSGGNGNDMLADGFGADQLDGGAARSQTITLPRATPMWWGQSMFNSPLEQSRLDNPIRCDRSSESSGPIPTIF
jgi:hypothetical protein